MLMKNLRRVATVVVITPIVLVGAPAIAMAQDGTQKARHGSSVDADRGDGILSNLVTVNLGRDSDSRDDRDDDGILSNLLTVDLGSSGRDRDRRDDRDERHDDGLLGDILGSDEDGGLLRLRLL